MKLVHQLLVEGTHLRVHQLLMNGQPHPQDVNLQQHVREVQSRVTSRRGSSFCTADELKAVSDLFLHQILQMCDPLGVFCVTAYVVLIKEGLLKQDRDERLERPVGKGRLPAALPPDIGQCLHSRRHL